MRCFLFRYWSQRGDVGGRCLSCIVHKDRSHRRFNSGSECPWWDLPRNRRRWIQNGFELVVRLFNFQWWSLFASSWRNFLTTFCFFSGDYALEFYRRLMKNIMKVDCLGNLPRFPDSLSSFRNSSQWNHQKTSPSGGFHRESPSSCRHHISFDVSAYHSMRNKGRYQQEWSAEDV